MDIYVKTWYPYEENPYDESALIRMNTVIYKKRTCAV